MHYGLDVSSNNPHPIDYQAVVDDLRSRGGGAQPFVIVKATQGTWYTNPDFHADIDGFIAAGAAVAAYLMDEGTADPAAEVTYFKSVAGGLPQYNDDELPQGLAVSAYITHCQALLAQNTGAPDYLNQVEENEGFPMGADGGWEANYNNEPGVTNKVGVLIHQFTSSGTVNGISGSVDLNAFLGTEAQFSQVFSDVASIATAITGGDPDVFMVCDATPVGGTTGQYLIRNGDVRHIPDATVGGWCWDHRSNTNDSTAPAVPWEVILFLNNDQAPT